MNGTDAEAKLKRCESELAQQKQQLAELSAEIESLSYSISHDLRAPLRAIQGFAKALSEDYEDRLDDDAKRFLQIIISGSTQMAQMIDALLSLSRLGRQPIKLAPVDMNQLVRSLIAELETKLKDRRINFKLNPLPEAEADLNLIRQVWLHLLTNAVKFTGGTNEAIVTVGSEAKPAETIYFVRDNGAGFDMNYATKLFGLFQRFHTEKEFPGIGSGLAIAQRLVRRHGGTIWADSKVNEGATFYFSLPNRKAE